MKPKGAFLKFLRRKEPGRTQSDVEKATGLPALRLSLYERGNSIPLNHLRSLAEYYGIPARELVEPESLSEAMCKFKELGQTLDFALSSYEGIV